MSRAQWQVLALAVELAGETTAWLQSPARRALMPSQFRGARNLRRRLDGNIEQLREAKTCPPSQRMS